LHVLFKYNVSPGYREMVKKTEGVLALLLRHFFCIYVWKFHSTLAIQKDPTQYPLRRRPNCFPTQPICRFFIDTCASSLGAKGGVSRVGVVETGEQVSRWAGELVKQLKQVGEPSGRGLRTHVPRISLTAFLSGVCGKDFGILLNYVTHNLAPCYYLLHSKVLFLATKYNVRFKHSLEFGISLAGNI